MGLGDELMALGHAQATFNAGDGRRVSVTDGRNIPRWHELWDGNPILAKPADVLRGEPVIRITNASGCRPYIAYPFTRETGWHWTGWRAQDHLGKLYFTPDEERVAGAVASAGPFVFVEPSVKRQATRNKDWGLERYIPVIDAFPSVRFVRPVYEDSRPFPRAEPLEGYTFRQICAIIARAEAYLGAEGACHHAAALAGVPGVVVFGGALDPEVTGYPIHTNLADGVPCGSWMPCAHCAAFFARLTTKHVVGALKPILRRVGTVVD